MPRDHETTAKAMVLTDHFLSREDLEAIAERIRTGKEVTYPEQVVQGIDSPSFLCLSPDGRFLLVANQDTNTIVSFKRDQETGLLTFQDEIEAPTPVCILFDS